LSFERDERVSIATRDKNEEEKKGKRAAAPALTAAPGVVYRSALLLGCSTRPAEEEEEEKEREGTKARPFHTGFVSRRLTPMTRPTGKENDD